ncbi:hypothetical protein EYF80_003322 [Liparis tanakae]|uniref:Uncharacterized protein n=1 Tax=Liparis tanakae TaxID=230148 RepID=A0A4Z2JAZ9_9TELE|nr:hypothetical protein EYF80_003322 [Liparis tanakae]
MYLAGGEIIMLSHGKRGVHEYLRHGGQLIDAQHLQPKEVSVYGLAMNCVMLKRSFMGMGSGAMGRLPLFQRAPPPCSIWAATRLRYSSSDTRGIGASRQTVLRCCDVRMPMGSLLVCKEEFQIFSNCM